jgi:hemolysin activation/secretion protein
MVWIKICARAGRFSAEAVVALAILIAGVTSVFAADSLTMATVDHIEAFGNTLLPQPAVDQVLLPYRGKLGFEQIQQAAQALQAAYRAAGYGAVVVQIPEQILNRGVVRLDVIEGRLSQIQVTGMHAFSKANVLRSLPSLVIGATPNLATLDSELLMVNENPAKAAHVVFQPGEKRAQVEALVVVEEQPVTAWQLSLDNTGNSATGDDRLNLSYQNANLWDLDNVLNLQLTTSPSDASQVGIGSVSLRTPLYAQHTFLEWSAFVSNTRDTPSQTAAGELNFSGQGTAFGVRMIRNLMSLGEFKQQVSMGLESRRYTNDCNLGSFGSAGCGSAGAPVRVLPLTLGYTLQKPGAQQWAVHWAANVAADSSDADFDAARAGAISHYQVLRANGSGVSALNSNWQLAWRIDTQYADQALVDAEQFGAGGSASVRGYPERALSADSGATTSLELRTRVSEWLHWGSFGVNQLALFVDAGTVANQGDKTCMDGQTRCTLWGSGVGLVSDLGQHTTLRTDFARAGSTVNETQTNDWRLHFSLNYSF